MASPVPFKLANMSSFETTTLSSIEEIIADAKAGRMVILVDDEDRENEGDLIVPAQLITPGMINFMAKEGRGLICLALDEAICDHLGLELMGRGDNSRHTTAFTVSIEAKEGVTTGISAADRAKTVQVAVNPASGPSDLATPGHIFPLRARKEGVLARAGHTEAAVDIARLAGLRPAGVICEVMNEDGTMARLPDLAVFAQRHDLKIGSIADLIAYRRRTENTVQAIKNEEILGSYAGSFVRHIYADSVQDAVHAALVKSIPSLDMPIPVAVHTLGNPAENDALTDDIVSQAMKAISEEEGGVVLLLAPSPDQTRIAGQILLDLGVRNMVLLSDDPAVLTGLDAYGINITGHRSLV